MREVPRTLAAWCAWCVCAALAGCAQSDATSGDAVVHTVVVQPVWFSGVGDGDRPTVDAFLRCLIEGSNLGSWWDGEVALILKPSVTLPAPPPSTNTDALVAWMGDRMDAAGIDMPEAEGAALMLLTFTDLPVVLNNACGRHHTVRLRGRDVALAVVRTNPLCWPTGDPVRSETQIAAHELLEGIDVLRGHVGCAGTGSCEGNGRCLNPCAAFVGLRCPGAPTGTRTGCGEQRVDGWVVQRFARRGRVLSSCHACGPCEFTPAACPGAPGCTAQSSGVLP